MSKLSTLTFLLFCLAGLAGCGTPAVRIGVSSTANLNLNAQNQPLPVVVRVYQLSESQAFESASFEQLWKDDLSVLGDALVMREEIVMDPAYQRRLEMPRHDQARYLAAIAIFRNPADAGWKAIDVLPDTFLSRRFSTSVRVTLKGNTIAIND